MGAVMTRPPLPVVKPMWQSGCTGEMGCDCPQREARALSEDHGTPQEYRRGCRCLPCQSANAERNRQYKANARKKK